MTTTDDFFDNYDENYIEEAPEGEAPPPTSAPTWVTMDALRALRDKMGYSAALKAELERTDWPRHCIGATVTVRKPARFKAGE